MGCSSGKKAGAVSALPRVAALLTTIPSDPNGLQRVLADARAAGQAAGVELEIICVLNDPRLPPPDLAGCRLVTAGLNLGYAGGLQLARSLTDADVLWVLQDDMSFAPETLGELLALLAKHPDAGVVSPISATRDARGNPQLRGGVVSAEGEFPQELLSPATPTSPVDELPAVNWLTLSGALVPAAAWDAVGGPDPAFFPLQSVDVEFCYRLTQAGFSMVLGRNAIINHSVGGSSAGLLKRFLNLDASRRFAAKHGASAIGAERGSSFQHPVELVTPQPDLISRVAESATLGFVDLARFASRELNLLRAELAQLRGEGEEADLESELAVANQHLKLRAELEAMRNSISWRITAPLRTVASRLMRRKR